MESVWSFLTPASFTCSSAVQWFNDTWYWAVGSAVLYVVITLLLKQWMTNRSPYKLKGPLLLWNIGLAVFSILGTLGSLPFLIRSVQDKGFVYTTCHSDNFWSSSSLCFCLFCFVVSKIFEYIDTLFLVLRKRPLIFLHVWHHATISLMLWYGFGQEASGMAHWCAGFNYTIHSIMYSYYAISSAGFKLPQIIPTTITILQMIQFAVASVIQIVAFIDRENCPYVSVAWMGAVLVISYLVLFLRYFLNRYVFKKAEKMKKT